MTGLLILLAVLVAITAALLWADAKGFDPWPWLYGTTDPRELVDRAHEWGES